MLLALLVTRRLLATKGISTRSKDATIGALLAVQLVTRSHNTDDGRSKPFHFEDRFRFRILKGHQARIANASSNKCLATRSKGLTSRKQEAISNKCHASSNRCLTTSNKKLVVIGTTNCK